VGAWSTFIFEKKANEKFYTWKFKKKKKTPGRCPSFPKVEI
jgi:hypothetical protein